ncbi:hypothetical protein [Kineococcus terrestris]|uniref:hypothetical protein n=1 Tax=Kineococcus terrestris TaxID=2044856 RepID=UPI0034DAE4C1
MRTLRPGRLFTTTAGVWVLDEVQPVAAVLDPADGGLRRLVSWTRLPPPPPGRAAVVRADDEALWVQNDPRGPLLRVPVEEPGTAVWAGGLTLSVAAGSSAWCTSVPPAQEIVHGAGAAPVGWAGMGTLLRADADGRVQRVVTDHPLRGLRTGAEAVWAQLDVEPWSLRELGAGAHEVVWSSRWVPLPRTGDLPEQVNAEDGQEAVPDDTVLEHVGDGFWHGYAFDPRSSVDSGTAVRAGRWTWRTGRYVSEGDDPDSGRRVVAAAFPTPGGVGAGGAGGAGAGAAGLIDLAGDARSRVVAATAAGDRLVVVVADDQAPSRVLAVDATTRSVQPWPIGNEPGGELDITAACWPLHPRPMDADSYTRQVLQDWSRLEDYWHGPAGTQPLAAGMSAVQVRLVGPWPTTRLECTFAFAPYRGLRLRRRLALFDELGAIAVPEHAQIHLMEDLDTRHLPPLQDAVDGVLDI